MGKSHDKSVGWPYCVYAFGTAWKQVGCSYHARLVLTLPVRWGIYIENKKVMLEIRERMIEQGLHPELVKKYLEQTAALQRTNFEIIAPTLSKREREEIEVMLLQGELLLAMLS
jgi:hypothetical protein